MPPPARYEVKPLLAKGQFWHSNEPYHRNDPSGHVKVLDFPKDPERKLLLVRYWFMGEEWVCTPEHFVERHDYVSEGT